MRKFAKIAAKFSLAVKYAYFAIAAKSSTLRNIGVVGIVSGAALILSSCSTTPVGPVVAPTASNPPVTAQGKFVATTWASLPGWSDDDFRGAWEGWQSGCRALEKRNPWQNLCKATPFVDATRTDAIRHFFEDNFVPYQLINADGTTSGMVTGYYEPLLRGSRTRSGVYQTPLYRYPQNWRGRAMPSSAEIRASNNLAGQEIVYVDDPVEAAFLQIQGSGRVQMTDGSMIRLGFAGTNEKPFRSIGRWLLDQGEIKPSQATMQGIKAWAKRNPSRVQEMLNINPRYVFFKELTIQHNEGPIGALGVPLSTERSIAVDPQSIPLGAPVYLATTRPSSTQTLQRLVFAQDTGSAIKGVVRADFFWGYGDEAGEQAGRMKQAGQMWVLWPK